MSGVADWAADLRRLSQALPEIATRAAPGIQADATATASAGTTPSGAAWPPRKDGGRALAGAAGELSVAASGAAVRVTLAGPSAIHHNGESNGPRRQVIPDDGEVPEGYARALDEAFREAVR